MLRVAENAGVKRPDFVAQYMGNELAGNWLEQVSALPGRGWARLAVPACFDGDVQGISVDDDELIAIDSARHVFTMDGALRAPDLFDWTERWGPPFWTGAGRTLPPGDLWSWSVLSPAEDRTWTDAAGNQQPVGDEKVSHIWEVRGGGRRLVYMDRGMTAFSVN